MLKGYMVRERLGTPGLHHAWRLGNKFLTFNCCKKDQNDTGNVSERTSFGHQGCGAAIQISGSSSSSSSMHLKFLLQLLLQHLRVFGSGTRMVWSIENWKQLSFCTTRLPHKLELCYRNPNSKLRLRLQHLNVFGSGSSFSHPKLLRLLIHSPC